METKWPQSAAEGLAEEGMGYTGRIQKKTSQLLHQPGIDETLNRVGETVLTSEGTPGSVLSIADEDVHVKTLPKPQTVTSQFKHRPGESCAAGAPGATKAVYRGLKLYICK